MKESISEQYNEFVINVLRRICDSAIEYMNSVKSLKEFEIYDGLVYFVGDSEFKLFEFQPLRNKFDHYDMKKLPSFYYIIFEWAKVIQLQLHHVYINNSGTTVIKLWGEEI